MVVGLAERLWGYYEDFRGVVGVGEHPVLALDRVERAGRDGGFDCSRSKNAVAIAAVPVVLRADLEPGQKTLTGGVAEVLYAHAKRMDVGTRVDLFGHAKPKLIHAVLEALAEAPAWMNGPFWT